MSQNHKSVQYTLPLVQHPDLTQYSYFVSESNKTAYQLVELWPNWPFKQGVVCGPKGYGKTHLGHILSDITAGVFIKAHDINQSFLENLFNKTYIVDDIQDIEDPRLLFHFYNIMVERNNHVVYLANYPPSKIDMQLADLNSRLRSLMVIELSSPDDELCRAIIKKVFADLQVSVGEDVIDYMLSHTSRALSDIHSNIQSLNLRALELKRNITIPFIKLFPDIK